MLSDVTEQLLVEAVFSAGIAMVGNTAYWIDKQANCQLPEEGTGYKPRYVIEEDDVSLNE